MATQRGGGPPSPTHIYHGNIDKVSEYLDHILGRSVANSVTAEQASPRVTLGHSVPKQYFSPYGARAQQLKAEASSKKRNQHLHNFPHLESTARSPARNNLTGRVVRQKDSRHGISIPLTRRTLVKVRARPQDLVSDSQGPPSEISPAEAEADRQLKRKLEDSANAFVKKKSIRGREVVVHSNDSNFPSSSSEDNFSKDLGDKDVVEKPPPCVKEVQVCKTLPASPTVVLRVPRPTHSALKVGVVVGDSNAGLARVIAPRTASAVTQEYRKDRRDQDNQKSPTVTVRKPETSKAGRRKNLFSFDFPQAPTVRVPLPSVKTGLQVRVPLSTMALASRSDGAKGRQLSPPSRLVSVGEGHREGALEDVSANEEVGKDVEVASPPLRVTLQDSKTPRSSTGKVLKRAPKGLKDAVFVKEKLDPECLTEDAKKYCCSKCCVGFLGKSNIRDIRTSYFLLSPRSRVHNITWGIQRSDSGQRLQTMSLPGGQQICRNAFKIILCIGNDRLNAILRKEERSVKKRTSETTPQGLLLREWMDSFFLNNTERLPDKNVYNLPSNFTKGEVYDIYKCQIGLSDPFSVMALSSFNRIWRKHFAAVKIPANSRFSLCEICEKFKAERDLSKTIVEKEESIRCLNIHREQQSLERQKLAKHRKKCYQNGKKYLGIVVDGMDQKKTAVPHFPVMNKKVESVTLVGVHLIGALVFNGTLSSKVFLTYGNLRADSNLTVTVINKILTSFEGPLPECLYLQLDNTTRENKNYILFAYLGMLVELRVFRKIKLGFLPVGHTHDQIDQMFSRFSTALKRLKAFTLPDLEVVIQESYKPKPKIELLRETYDFKAMLERFPKPVCKLADMTFNQKFRFKIDDEDTGCRVWSKQFSTDKHWLPKDGLRHIVGSFRYLPILSSEQITLKSYAEMKKYDKGGRNVNPIFAFEDIKKQITQNCFGFFNDLQKIWWEQWFAEQADIAFKIAMGTLRPLEDAWVWPPTRVEDTEAEVRPVASENILVTEEEVRAKIFGPRRPMYAGSRQARPGTKMHDRHHRLGDIDEIDVGSFIAVVSSNDYNPFWICEALAIKSRTKNREPKFVQIQWYKSSGGEGSDPFESAYGKEFVHKKRGRHSVDELNIEDIDIQSITVLAFNFVLTSANQLRKVTVATIREQLFLHAQEDAQPSASASGADDEDVGADDDVEEETSDFEYHA